MKSLIEIEGIAERLHTGIHKLLFLGLTPTHKA